MRIKLAVLGAALTIVLALGAIAAYAATPPAGKAYFSKSPGVSITVGKPAKFVKVIAVCFTKAVGDVWQSGRIPLVHGSFRYDKSAKIETESKATFGSRKGTVLVTGTFKNGRFTGTMELAGSGCAKGGYTASLNSKG